MNKKYKTLSIIFFLLFIVSFIVWMLNYPVPDVTGLPYAEARAEVINAGWEPLPPANKDLGWKGVRSSYESKPKSKASRAETLSRGEN